MKNYVLHIVENLKPTSYLVTRNTKEPLFDFFCKLFNHTFVQAVPFVREYGNVIPATCETKRNRIEWRDNKGNAILLVPVNQIKDKIEL